MADPPADPPPGAPAEPPTAADPAGPRARAFGSEAPTDGSEAPTDGSEAPTDGLEGTGASVTEVEASDASASRRHRGSPPRDPLRDRLYIIIFEAETPAGKLFDVVLLWLIILSVLTVTLESVSAVAHEHGTLLRVLEWIYTVVFSIEYALRIYCARRRWRYIVSFFGVIDLLALLPTYLSLFFAGVHTLLVIRALRLLRVFRVLKVVRMLGEAHSLLNAIRVSLPKISVFLGAVTIVALVVGAAMYLIEGEAAGFTSIPRGMYWAIVTMTTVGYGDIAPRTELGQFLAAILMILGYGILAVPTGIVSAEIVGHRGEGDAPNQDQALCHACGATGHVPGANFCYVCGSAVD